VIIDFWMLPMAPQIENRQLPINNESKIKDREI